MSYILEPPNVDADDNARLKLVKYLSLRNAFSINIPSIGTPT